MKDVNLVFFDGVNKRNNKQTKRYPMQEEERYAKIKNKRERREEDLSSRANRRMIF